MENLTSTSFSSRDSGSAFMSQYHFCPSFSSAFPSCLSDVDEDFLSVFAPLSSTLPSLLLLSFVLVNDVDVFVFDLDFDDEEDVLAADLVLLLLLESMFLLLFISSFLLSDLGDCGDFALAFFDWGSDDEVGIALLSVVLRARMSVSATDVLRRVDRLNAELLELLGPSDSGLSCAAFLFGMIDLRKQETLVV